MNLHDPKAAPARPLMTERQVSLIGTLMIVLGPISMSLFTPAMPELVKVFGTTESMVKTTLSAYFAGFALTQLVCGPLSDAYGRKRVTLLFLAIYVAASALAVFAPTIELLIGARFLQGVGAAVGVAVSRALIRDLFTGEASHRIMNLTGMLMALGPSLAPTLGGILLETTGWQSIFLFMLVAGMVIALTIWFVLVETVTPDPSRFRLAPLARSYRSLLKDRYFMLASLAMAGGVGTFYTQATVLPFIMMGPIGLTPSQFGLAMLLQSMPFFLGGVIFRVVMSRFSARRLVPVGMAFMAVGYSGIALSLTLFQPTLLNVMLPVACFTFGVAFIMPSLGTATVAPFPHMAGAASSFSSFVQMGGGFLGGVIVAMIGNPVLGMATIVPLMGAISIVAWLMWRRLPEPAMARVVLPRSDPVI